MKKQFCNYDISLKLKNLGFDEPCLAWYNLNTLCKLGYWKQEKNIWKNSELNTRYITAPLFQQVIDWFREKYNIHISLLPHNDVEFSIRIRYNKSTLIHGGYKTYEEAREQSIIKAIEILEENDVL
jgi:hypothetical protein